MPAPRHVALLTIAAAFTLGLSLVASCSNGRATPPPGVGRSGGTPGATGTGGSATGSGGGPGGGPGTQSGSGGVGTSGSSGGQTGTGGTAGLATGGAAATSGGTTGGGGAADGSTAGARGTGGGTSGTGGNGSGDRGGASGASSVIAAGVRWFGRVDTANAVGPRFAWSGTGFIARFSGTSLAVRLNNGGAFVFKAIVDGVPRPTFAATTGMATYDMTGTLAAGTHTVALYRQTEGVYGDSQFLGLTVGGAGMLMDPPPPAGRLIEVVGASVSCGYGNLGVPPCGFSFATESHYDTYESVAARALDAELSVVAISGRGVSRNTDGTTDGTMPKLYGQILAGAATPAWDFRTTPAVVVINLGKNDFTVGDPGAAFTTAYVAFVHTLRGRYPNALIVCATGPNLGAAAHAQQVVYVNSVIATVRAAGDSRIELLDWPEETAAEEGCDVHPNAAKQLSMGNALTALLRSKLSW